VSGVFYYGLTTCLNDTVPENCSSEGSLCIFDNNALIEENHVYVELPDSFHKFYTHAACLNSDWVFRPTSNAQGPGIEGFMDGLYAYDTTFAYIWKCDEREELSYDEENSADVIADNSSAYIGVIGGKPPYIVTVDGQGFYLDSQRTAVAISTESKSILVYTSDACGYCDVSITDNCGDSVDAGVRSTNGSWHLIASTRGGGLADQWADGFFCRTSNFYGSTLSQPDQIIGNLGLTWDGGSSQIPDPTINRDVMYGIGAGCPGNASLPGEGDGPAFCKCGDFGDEKFGVFHGFNIQATSGRHSLTNYPPCQPETRHCAFVLASYAHIKEWQC
jgi:hypothetical protein